MDSIYGQLGRDVAECLRANEIDRVETFLLLTQSMVMAELGLKLGSWLKIKQIQETLFEYNEETSVKTEAASSSTIEDDMTTDAVIEILKRNNDCQSLIHGKLAEGALLKRSEKNLICRTVCSHYFVPLIMQGRSITIAMKTKLAQCVVEAYESLKIEEDGKPAEVKKVL